MTLLATLLTLVVGLPAIDDVPKLAAALRAGPWPEAGFVALDEHLAFERALFDVLQRAGPDGDRQAEALLRQSPVRVPRSFTDGRVPTGWDLALQRAEAALAGRRPELADGVAGVRQLLAPDVWQVADGIAALDALVAAGGDDGVVSAVLHQVADRLAPFPSYARALEPIVERGVALAPFDHVRHVAALRLAAGIGGVRPESARPLWDGAIRSAPTLQDAELLRLAAATAAGRAADPSWRDQSRIELAKLIEDAEVREVVERALVRLALTAPTMVESLRHVRALDGVGASRERVDGLLLVLVRDRRTKQDVTVPAELHGLLADAIERAAGSERLPCLHWAAATAMAADVEGPETGDEHGDHADHEGHPGQEAGGGSGVPRPGPLPVDTASDEAGTSAESWALFTLAAQPALNGAEPTPMAKPISEWWLPLDEVPERSLRPIEYARAACWRLAEAAWLEQRWDDVLLYGAFPPPAKGCGNVAAATARVAGTRRADALEGLGRGDESIALRIELLATAPVSSDVSWAALELAEGVVRLDAETLAMSLLGALPGVIAERRDLARELIALRRAYADERGDAASLAEALRERHPGRPEVLTQLRKWERGEG